MRDPERIDIILDLLGQVWKECPDLRLCQLIYILTQMNDSFYFEDDELMVVLKDAISRQKI